MSAFDPLRTSPRNGNTWIVAVAASAKHRWAWFLLPLPWAIGMAFGISSAIRNFHIAKREQTTEAVVIAHHPEDHQGYDLSLTYEGSPYVGRVYPQYVQLSVGRHVSVYFDPDAPQTMSLTSFQVQGERDLGAVPLALLGTIALECFAFWQWKRRPKGSSSEA